MKKCLAWVLMVSALTVSGVHAEEHGDYSRGVLEKAGNGFANLTTAMLEMPKSVINTTNQSNIVYGVFGGMLKGTVNMVGRMGVGLVDLITAPIPTKPIIHPVLVWDNFDVDTQYGEVFRLPKEYE
ncbi:MAG: exosortase system-associated protein, TIGR04073 family [Methylococcales bacterium]|nr:exosortase system-associated protein, TIGR04073 family [Methylococcales bacterium]